MSEDLVRRYANKTVPRYTSYPTAADFTSAVGPAEQARWLGEIGSAEPLSIYLHIPYCRELCAYCGCHAKATRRSEIVDAYRASLEAEIRLVGRRLTSRPTVARLAWGGGTPSILGVDGLEAVLRVLGEVFDFASGFSHAIELDPRTLDTEICEGLARLGVNRASLGVQDLDPDVQTAIGRVQPIALVEKAVGDLRVAGIAELNFDLIYGLPRQTEDGIQRTCGAVATLKPDRIAAYGYAHLPARRANQRLIEEAELPSAAERFHQARLIASCFEEHGYETIGIDHFAQPRDPLAQAARQGRLHRDFQGYTDDPCQTLIGFGASAISHLSGGYVQNESAIGTYRERIAADQLCARRGHCVTSDDRERASIIERLMCDFRTDLGDSAARFADELALLRAFAADGMVELASGSVAVTKRGQPFTRLVAAVFDRFRVEAAGGFSCAV